MYLLFGVYLHSGVVPAFWSVFAFWGGTGAARRRIKAAPHT